MSIKELKMWMGDNKFELGVLSLVFGVLLTVLAFFGGPREETPDFLLPMVETVSQPTQWYLYFWLFGPLLFILGCWYAYDTYKKRKKFEELMAHTGRAKFFTNLVEIEELAWALKRKDRIRLAEKKAGFKKK